MIAFMLSADRRAPAAPRQSSKACAGRRCALTLRTNRTKARLHGALSVDYVVPMMRRAALDRLQPATGRTDERVSCRARSGRIAASGSQGERPQRAESREGAGHTFHASPARMRVAGGTRRDVIHECWLLLTGSGPYADSTEELTRCGRTGSARAGCDDRDSSADRSEAGGDAGEKSWGAHLLDVKASG